MNNNENFLDITSIKFGNIRFLIKQTRAVEEYFTKNFSEEELNKLMPSAGTWYSQVLGLLGLDHKEEAEVEVVIYSVISDDESQKEIIEDKDKVKEFSEFIESPLKIKNPGGGEEKLRIKFALRIKSFENKNSQNE